LAAARAIKAHDAGAVPLWVYTGQAVGEPASTQGFQVFLDGTNDRLYDDSTQKWEISGPGFTATWNLLQRMRPYEEPESDWSNPQAEATLALTLIPAQQVGIVFEGNWIATAYIPGGLHPWKGFYTQYGEARIPTENGQAPGFDTLSGGWALSVPRLAAHPKISLAFIEAASSAKRLAPFDVTSGSLPPRSDVLDLPVWQDATKVNPVIGFSTALLPHTNCRPDLPVYVQVSNELQQLTGEISMGSITGAQAAAQYASAITKIVGAGDVEHRNK
jgi:multiple sugar transport system substrate-binding protein